ncbi:MAG TPA: sodium-translocating pyrophosphatase [Armatimonadota bacterium]|nr:sodium-translocating pyrophosphatase [Armatimonadota bacterium]
MDNSILPQLGGVSVTALWCVLGSAVVSLLFGGALGVRVLKRSPGSEAMQRVSLAIQEGAGAYLSRQIRMMRWFLFALAFVLYFMFRTIYAHDTSLRPGQITSLSIGVAVAFLVGALFSYLSGYAGMYMAVRANCRTAAAALTGMGKALQVAFQAGAVSGMATVGLGLLGATAIILVYREQSVRVLIGFGFGASLAALFMRVGGGIFTKAADVGADLVGKVEAGIPEDDPRNAAVIADNVGDNVGDCAGMVADVFESYGVTLVAAIILGAAVLADPGFRHTYGVYANTMAVMLIIYPMLVRAIGVAAGIIGVMAIGDRDDVDPMQAINRGFYLSCAVAVVGSWAVNYFYLRDPATGHPDFRFFGATITGIGLALAIGFLTEHYTATHKPHVKEIAAATTSGAATMLLQGIASGMESSVWAIVAIAITIGISMEVFHGSVVLAAYGIALAALGLLTPTSYMLAMDTFGPISDNANGIFEMSGSVDEELEARGKADPTLMTPLRVVAQLDAVGNTTKALTKGFAIATAVLAAIALYGSFVSQAGLGAQIGRFAHAAAGIQLNLPEVFIGFLIGGAVPFLFSSFAIRAVSRAAQELVTEVRRQFRSDPGIMAGTSVPDYARCVDISTAAAQRELLGPALLAIFSPILVAFTMGLQEPFKGAEALGGFLGGAILSAQLLAVFLSNSGGAWDNAKKSIEDGSHGGKGSDSHKAAIIGDTVGDPFKDTAGPALNPMIKVMNLVALLIVPIVIDKGVGTGVRGVIVAISLIALAVAVIRNKASTKSGIEELGITGPLESASKPLTAPLSSVSSNGHGGNGHLSPSHSPALNGRSRTSVLDPVESDAA